MKDIEFRGLRLATREWAYGQLLYDNCGYAHIMGNKEDAPAFDLDDAWVDNETIGQFTGRTDCLTAFAPEDCADNDIKIFDGDILFVVLADGTPFNGEVYFNDDDLQWRIRGEGHDIELSCGFHMIVKGNIHEQPELLNP